MVVVEEEVKEKSHGNTVTVLRSNQPTNQPAVNDEKFLFFL